MSNDTLRVLTLNCWGLKYVASDRDARIRGIAESLASSSYDIVGLQELWVHADFEYLRGKLAKNLPYGKFFFSGALGAGLAIFSRFPITSASVRPYPLNGSPLAVAAGDWFVGKAAGSVTLSHPTLGELEVFTTHLYASGGEDGPEERRAHRLVQSWELANLVRNAADRGRHVLLLGDLNSIPTALSIALLRDHARLTDAFAISHPTPPAPGTAYSLQSAHLAIRDLGITADSPLNSYSAHKALDASAKRWQGKRLDYIFFRGPERGGKAEVEVACTESSVVFTDKVPGYDFSFSDHFGFAATFAVRPSPSPKGPSAAAPLSPRTLTLTLQALAAAYRTSRSRSRMHLSFFLAAVAALLALIIGSAWQPDRRVNPLFVLLGAAATWGGTTMLYVGFVYGRWEVRALLSAIEEMELVQGQGRRGEGSQDSSTN